jgi:hypothetical protein
VSGFINLGIPAKSVEHFNAPGNFTISLPETWTPMDIVNGNHGDKSVVLIVRNTLETLYIDVSKYENMKSLVEIENWSIEKIINESPQTYELIYKGKNQGEQYSGILHEYVITKTHPFLGKRGFHCLDWYTIPKADAGFRFSFCVEEKYWEKTKDTLMEIINSVNFH